jgi:hypothetical protein
MKIWDGSSLCRLIGVAVVIGGLSVGCGQKVEMKPINSTAGMNQADVEVVKQHLEKAGIKGEVMKMEDLAPGEDAWLVVVNMMGAPEPGKRATPVPPKSYRVSKGTGKVESGGI